jgi:hypothetical protein
MSAVRQQLFVEVRRGRRVEKTDSGAETLAKKLQSSASSERAESRAPEKGEYRANNTIASTQTAFFKHTPNKPPQTMCHPTLPTNKHNENSGSGDTTAADWKVSFG